MRSDHTARTPHLLGARFLSATLPASPPHDGSSGAPCRERRHRPERAAPGPGARRAPNQQPRESPRAAAGVRSPRLATAPAPHRRGSHGPCVRVPPFAVAAGSVGARAARGPRGRRTHPSPADVQRRAVSPAGAQGPHAGPGGGGLAGGPAPPPRLPHGVRLLARVCGCRRRAGARPGAARHPAGQGVWSGGAGAARLCAGVRPAGPLPFGVLPGLARRHFGRQGARN